MKLNAANGLLACMIWLACLPASGQDRFTDPRDGEVYPLVEIGEQVWMAANLRYAPENHTCYENDPAECGCLGVLYTWEEAQEACPAGWHLPSEEEWKTLAAFLGEGDAGQKLKACPGDPVPWDGTNASGFSAIPAGAGNGEGFHRKGDWALFWSSTEYGPTRAWFAQLDGFWYPAPPRYRNLYVGWYYLKSNQFSVRCLRDRHTDTP